jgi:hypothetical protein
MAPSTSSSDRRALLDARLTELVLLTKGLCPSATVEASTLPYEDEDGWVQIFTPSHLSDAEEDSVEMAVAERAAQIFDETGLYILCAIVGPAPR